MENLTFEVFNQRRSSILTYRINKTENGWYIKHIAINGECEVNGHPYFYMNFDQDSIAYPNDFGDYLEHLWRRINDGEIESEEAQSKLQELADWVTICEKSSPQWKGWSC